MRAVDQNAIGNSANNADQATDTSREETDEMTLQMDDIIDDETVDNDAFAAKKGLLDGRVAPVFALFLLASWTAFYVWAVLSQGIAPLAAPPSQWAGWIVEWSIPVLLLGVGWLLVMRNSRAESRRFANSAALLSNESAELENRLTVVNRELSLAREFLASQSLELESLGRIASERLSERANELQALVQDNGAQVEAIGTASETALANMTRLRDDLPVVANSARDMSNQIGNAGRTAKDQLDELEAGFARIDEAGGASEAKVAGVGEQVEGVLTNLQSQLSSIEGLVTGRYEALSRQAEEYRATISESETEILSAMKDRVTVLQSETRAVAQSIVEGEKSAETTLRASIGRLQGEMIAMIGKVDELDGKAVESAKVRIKALHHEAGQFDEKLAQRDAKFIEEVEKRQSAFETREAQASETLSQRLTQLDDLLAERREAQKVETAKLVAEGGALNEEVQRFNELVGQVGANSEATRATLSNSINSLDEQLASKQVLLAETETQLAKLTEDGIRLLEIIQSGAQHSREDLPQAIAAAASDLGSVEERAEALTGVMFKTSQHSSELTDKLVQAQSEIEKTDTSIDAIQSKLAEQSEDTLAKLQGLRTRLSDLSNESEDLATGAQDSLREALGQLETATKSAFNTLEEGAREKIDALANSISGDAVEALEDALRVKSAEAIGALEQSASHASGVSREATIQLRDQLAKVNELTANLEQRIARARELSEEQVNNDFSKRMALITDSLNSNAIDISAALSSEVSDNAWDDYLKGDRGIFTRRAVSLIDSGDARDISELYQSDEAFKANVSRYIHDFEAMLRSMLSTREGNALSVTMLGSNMGKLYVLLAQAIERFRN